MATKMRWTRLTEHAGWSARVNAFWVSFNGLIFSYGGASSGTSGTDSMGDEQREIWSSPDGITWTFRGLLPFYFTHGGSRVIRGGGLLFNGEIVLEQRGMLVGAPPGSNHFNTIWSSADGVNFTLRASSNISTGNPITQAENALGYSSGSFMYWPYDGGATYFSRSSNFTTWALVSAFPSFSPPDNLFLLGSTIYGIRNALRKSINGGSSWLTITPPVGFNSSLFPSQNRSEYASCNNGSSIFIHGGTLNAGDVTFPVVSEVREDLWILNDGQFESMEQVFPTGEIGPRAFHGLVYHNGKFYLMGGTAYRAIDQQTFIFDTRNDVWEGVLVEGSGVGGNGGVPPEEAGSHILPDSTGKLSHARILLGYRSQAQAQQFHDLMRGST